MEAIHNWDGKTKYPLGTEMETIIQRGTTFRIKNVEINNGRIYIDLDVVAQI